MQRGRRCAPWTDRYGRKQTALVIRGRDGRDRIRRVTSTLVVKLRDAGGVVRTVNTHCRSKDAAEALQADMRHRNELVKAGVLTAAEDAASGHFATSIDEHAVAYVRHLSRTASQRHTDNTKRQLDRVVSDCGFRRLSDMRSEALERWLTLRRQEGMGARTSNTYRGTTCAFARWCVETGRLAVHPFVRVPKADERTDCRRRRRSLRLDEMHRLLTVSRLRPVAEYGRAVENTGLETRKRSNWHRRPLSFETIHEDEIRGRQALASRPDVLSRLEFRGSERALMYKTFLLTGLRKRCSLPCREV